MSGRGIWRFYKSWLDSLKPKFFLHFHFFHISLSLTCSERNFLMKFSFEFAFHGVPIRIGILVSLLLMLFLCDVVRSKYPWASTRGVGTLHSKKCFLGPFQASGCIFDVFSSDVSIFASPLKCKKLSPSRKKSSRRYANICSNMTFDSKEMEHLLISRLNPSIMSWKHKKCFPSSWVVVVVRVEVWGFFFIFLNYPFHIYSGPCRHTQASTWAPTLLFSHAHTHKPLHFTIPNPPIINIGSTYLVIISEALCCSFYHVLKNILWQIVNL